MKTPAATVAIVVALSAGCGGSVVGVTGGHAADGPAAIEAYGCGACHTIPGIRSADADVGPSLADFAERITIAGSLTNTPDNVVRWIRFPQEVRPGSVMPDMGVGLQSARDIAAYLYRH